MKDLVIIGCGGLGRETAWLVEEINKSKEKPEWNLLGFIDENKKGETVNGYKVLGGDDWFSRQIEKVYVVCAIADCDVRKKIITTVSSFENVEFPSLIAPDVRMSESVEIGEGCIVSFGCIFTVNIKIGAHVIFGLGNKIGHDSRVGDFCTFNYNTAISGNVFIEECVTIGTGVSIKQGINIAPNCILGMGAAVVKDTEKCGVYVGVPAKILEK